MMKKWLSFLIIALCLFSFAPDQTAKAQANPDEKPATNLQDYVGRYEADPTVVENFIFDLFLDKDELWIKASHSVKRKLAAKAADAFTMTDLEVPVKFSRDAKGIVTSLTLEAAPSSDGRKITARKLDLPPPGLKGNTTFRLKGYPGARVVAVAGSFNEFKQSQLLCGKEGDGWVCRIDLAPGKYTYKFIIDGDWILDPENPTTEDDERGFTNSVVVVKGN
jgi:AMP-activated protein kinase-like protein/uncharacterized protein DUF3471